MGNTPRKNAPKAGTPPAPPTPDPTRTAGGYAVAPPTEVMAQPGGLNTPYYANVNQLPQTGGLMRPTSGPGGPMIGAGLNWTMPPPPPPPAAPRNTLAQMLTRANQGATFGRGGDRGSNGYSGSASGGRGGFGGSSARSGGLY